MISSVSHKAQALLFVFIALLSILVIALDPPRPLNALVVALAGALAVYHVRAMLRVRELRES